MANGIFKRHINRSIGGNILVFLFLLVFGIFFVFPIFYAVITAFKPLNEIFIFPPRLFVSRPTLDNFIELDLMTASFWVPLSRYIFNSLFISVVGTAGHLLLSSMAAYPLAKHPFPGNGWIKQMIVISLLFTPAVTYLPQYVVLAQLHMINTYWALILPAMALFARAVSDDEFYDDDPDGNDRGGADRRGGRISNLCPDHHAERQAGVADSDYLLLPGALEQRRRRDDLSGGAQGPAVHRFGDHGRRHRPFRASAPPPRC